MVLLISNIVQVVPRMLFAGGVDNYKILAIEFIDGSFYINLEKDKTNN